MYSFHFGSDLSHLVGRPGADLSWEANGDAGVLVHGPYVQLPPGRYSALLKLYRQAAASNNASFGLDVVSDLGSNKHLAISMRCRDLSVTSTPVYLDFELLSHATVEVRVIVTSESHIGIRELTIFSRR